MNQPIGIPPGRVAAVLLGTAFVLCWSSGFVGAKLGAQDADARTVLMWRFLPLAAVLLPWAVARARRSALPSRREVARQALVGALSQTGYLASVYGAVTLGVSTGTTALVDGLQPIVVAALAAPLLGTAVAGRQWAGLAVGAVGVLTVTWADASSPRTDAPAWAYGVPALGMACLVAATFLERRAAAPPRPLQNLAVHVTVSAVLFTGAAVAGGAATVPADGSFWLATAWLVLLPTFGGYGLYWVLLDRVGVTAVNGLLFLVPPVTTAWGAATFGEPVTAGTVAGLAMAGVATWLVVAGPRDDDAAPGSGAGRCGDRGRPAVTPPRTASGAGR